jgi:hypothetical protein
MDEIKQQEVVEYFSVFGQPKAIFNGLSFEYGSGS